MAHVFGIIYFANTHNFRVLSGDYEKKITKILIKGVDDLKLHVRMLLKKGYPDTWSNFTLI